ncbi:MAG: hypothetical protein ACO3F5_03185 [Gemmatimonadaceae bacterium]
MNEPTMLIASVGHGSPAVATRAPAIVPSRAPAGDGEEGGE